MKTATGLAVDLFTTYRFLGRRGPISTLPLTERRANAIPYAAWVQSLTV
jgi:hypothetical protein